MTDWQQPFMQDKNLHPMQYLEFLPEVAKAARRRGAHASFQNICKERRALVASKTSKSSILPSKYASSPCGMCISSFY